MSAEQKYPTPSPEVMAMILKGVKVIQTPTGKCPPVVFWPDEDEDQTQAGSLESDSDDKQRDR